MKKLWFLILLALTFNAGAQQMRWDIPSSSIVFPTNFWSASTSNVLFIVAPSLATKLNIVDFQLFTNTLGSGAFAPTNNFATTQFVYAGGQWHFINFGNVTNLQIYATDIYGLINIQGTLSVAGIASPTIFTTTSLGTLNNVDVSTKGDIPVGNGMVVTKISAGADGTALIADSSAPTGYSFGSVGTGTLTTLTNAGNASFSLINASNAPAPKLKSLSFTNGVAGTDQGTNILVTGTTIAAGTNGIVLITNGSVVTISSTKKFVNYSITMDTNSSTTTTQIPIDSTIPQSSEGAQFGTYSYSAAETNNTVFIRISGICGTTLASSCVQALFLDSGTDARTATLVSTVAGGADSFILNDRWIATDKASHTWALRFGPGSVTTGYINRTSTGTIFANKSFVTVEFWEMLP